MIGIRDDVEDLAEDRFQAPGLSVLNLKLDLVQLGENHYSGEYNLQTYKDFCDLLILLDQKKLIKYSQVVGLGGLAWNLMKMCFDGVGFQANELTKKVQTNEWTRDCLYQVILAVEKPRDVISQIAHSNLKNKLECVELGITGGERLFFNEACQWDISELRQRYDQGLAPCIS